MLNHRGSVKFMSSKGSHGTQSKLLGPQSIQFMSQSKYSFCMRAAQPYLKGDMYPIQPMASGICLRLIRKPENSINGIIMMGVAETHISTTGNMQPARSPMLRPLRPKSTRIPANTKNFSGSFQFSPTVQYVMRENRTGKTICVGRSLRDLPRKYGKGLYIRLDYSRRNSALSVGNTKMTTWTAVMIQWMHKKKRSPFLSQTDSSS